MALRQMKSVQAHEYTNGTLRAVNLEVSAEYPLTLYLNGVQWGIFACSGSDIEFLVAGHLAAQGVLSSPDDVIKTEVDQEKLSVHVWTRTQPFRENLPVHVGTTASGLDQSPFYSAKKEMRANTKVMSVAAETVLSSMKEFLGLSELHRRTHGVHGAALYTLDGGRIAFFDEIGRHNAIDKVLGYALYHRVDLKNVMVLSTGRLAHEIIEKLAAAGAALVVSRAAPTSRSIETAHINNIIMIGRVTGDRFYVYNGWESVKCS